MALVDGDGSHFQSACKNTVRTEFKIQLKLNHLVNWVNAQSVSGTATTIFTEDCLQTLDTALLQEAWGFFIFVWFWLFKILFQNSYQVCAIKCGDPRLLQQLPIYRNQYWTNKSDFNACQWLSQSRRHSKVPKNISKYTDLLKRT